MMMLLSGRQVVPDQVVTGLCDSIDLEQLMTMDQESESAKLDREIAALLVKKAAAQAKEQRRAKVEDIRRANILVETSPVKKKIRESPFDRFRGVLQAP